MLNIVLGRELRPTASEESTSTAQRRPTAAITKWESQNALACQALLACLEPAELTKVYRMKSSHDIWQRLSEEYGAISDIRLAHAEAALYTLLKQPETPMQTHIDQFTSLQ